LVDITSRDCRINATPITIEFKLQGSVSHTGLYLLSGEWRALTDLNCSFCCQKMDYLLIHHYDNLRLIDETLSSLDYEGECFECRFDLFDLNEWLFSELMLVLPLAPRHETNCVKWENNNITQTEEKVSRKLYEILADNQHNR